eukprot:5152136-Amphidinium_carterae.1
MRCAKVPRQGSFSPTKVYLHSTNPGLRLPLSQAPRPAFLLWSFAMATLPVTLRGKRQADHDQASIP